MIFNESLPDFHDEKKGPIMALPGIPPKQYWILDITFKSCCLLTTISAIFFIKPRIFIMRVVTRAMQSVSDIFLEKSLKGFLIFLNYFEKFHLLQGYCYLHHSSITTFVYTYVHHIHC